MAAGGKDGGFDGAGAIFLARPERPVSGRRLAVKDLFDTAGLTTTYGSEIFAGHVPERTAEAVSLLEAAGWANAGKTNLHEFAYGITSQNPHYGTVPNPVAPGRIAGGSSGGNAAALAAGEVEGALGSDSGGSVRIPAACCGVVGFKPTHGLVSLDGCFPLAPSFDTAGPMARSVAVCAEMLSALVPGFEPGELESLERLRVGVTWTAGADASVRARVEAAAASFANARAIEVPFADEVGPLFMHEVAGVHRELFAATADRYGENVRTKVGRCLEVTESEADGARRAREEYHAVFADAFAEFDLLLTPTIPCLPHGASVDELEIRARYVRFTLPFNALGAPALALPCGRTRGGLPISAQLAGPPRSDARVLAAGMLLERALATSRR